MSVAGRGRLARVFSFEWRAAAARHALGLAKRSTQPTVRSLILDPGACDHVAPFGDVGAYALRELLGRAGLGIDALSREGSERIGVAEDRADFAIEARNDGGRRCGRRQYRLPGADLVAGNAGFGDGRHVG